MISWVTLDRVVEQERAADATYRRMSAGKALRSDAKPLSDDDLLAKLRSFGIDLDRASLGRLCSQALSAQEITQPLLDQRAFHSKQQRMESDRIWICLSALWQRWFPHVPCFELLDDKMQAGYGLRAAGDAKAVCRIWLEAWNDVLGLLDKGGMQSIHEFDERYGGTQSLFNWIQDLVDELWNAGLADPQLLRARIGVCEEGLRRFSTDDELLTENRRRALAESYYQLGETGKAEGLYRDWLKADPRWGWGWIGWSDCYRFTRAELRDWARCEQLLREGLAVAEVRDRADLIDRLADVCQEQGRGEEAEELWRQAKQSVAAMETSMMVSPSGSQSGSVLRQKTTINFGGEGLPLSALSNVTAMLRGNSAPASSGKAKVGRNDRCPCGSGKKFKKCCGG
jgi:tetratricopeptide (TPR) repeat protein